jgi:Carbohydrate-binding module 48 (Isoamylase N-terminal domain).
MAAAAAIVGFVARGLSLSARDAVTPPAPSSTAASAPAPVATTARFVASNASDVVAVPQQFVLENSHAHSISVVGDFNKWNPASARMERSGNGTLWSAIVPVLPGRHMYGFMIDDSIFVLAPGGQTVRDPDLGTEASVLLVRRP